MNLQQLTTLYDFTGRTVVITGGTGVLGRAITSALAECGANVVLLARDPARADALVGTLGPARTRTLVVKADVLDAESLAAAARAAEAFGRVDCLINGAGGNRPEATTGPTRPFFDLPAAAIREVFELNLAGTILPSQIFGRLMAARREGVILNISSMGGLRPLTRVAAYSAAKAAVTNFTQWLAVHMAQEYSPRIRVNAIAPGFFFTDQNRFLLTDERTGELTDRGRAILAHTPAGRFGEPADLLGAVLWLLSPASAFVTGVVVPIDGGFAACSGV